MPAKRKLLGLTGPSSFTVECTEMIEELLEANYVLLYQNNDTNLKQWLEVIDGLIVAGGVDIHPTVYEESIWTNCNLTKFDLKRDFKELSLINYCLKNSRPILGICRGHQLLGIKYGMKLVMDLTTSVICHQPQRSQIQTARNEPIHSVQLLDWKRFYTEYNMPEPVERATLRTVLAETAKDRLWVNSFHHQGLIYQKKRDEGVTILGISQVDLPHCSHIVEFMEGSPKNWISVQWHPEYDWKDNTVSRTILENFKKMLG